jgi:hypothetical protein
MSDPDSRPGPGHPQIGAGDLGLPAIVQAQAQMAQDAAAFLRGAYAIALSGFAAGLAQGGQAGGETLGRTQQVLRAAADHAMQVTQRSLDGVYRCNQGARPIPPDGRGRGDQGRGPDGRGDHGRGDHGRGDHGPDGHRRGNDGPGDAHRGQPGPAEEALPAEILRPAIVPDEQAG